MSIGALSHENQPRDVTERNLYRRCVHAQANNRINGLRERRMRA